jgi:Cu(I)/Ag(I) efflux system membrane fusion protein
MDLVAASAAQSSGGAAVHVDSATQQKLGVTLATATRRPIARTLHTYGTIAADDSLTFVVTPTVSGVLTQLTASHVGQRLAAGQVLYEIQSDALLQWQHEYVDFLIRRAQTLRNAEVQRERNSKLQQEMQEMDAAGREQMERNLRQSEEQIQAMLQPMERDGIRLTTRLKNAGVTEAMLKEVARTGRGQPAVRVPLQQACLVQAIGARAGMTVEPGTPIVTCAGEKRLWLELALYPDQMELVQAGDMVSARGDGGAVVEGRLTQPSGIVDPGSRTVRVRVPIEAKGLHVGDYFDVSIQAEPHPALSIPRSALIRTGHGDFVILAQGSGHFLPTPVTVALETNDLVAISDGLQEGAQVVVNGNFLLDSAASLSAAVARMSGADAPR